MKLGGQGDCRRRDRRWEVPATSRRKQRRPWFNTTTERIRPRHVHVAGGPSEGRRALVQRLSRGSQATSERHTEEALALTDWSGAPFPDEAVEGQGGAPLSGGQLRGDRSTQPGRGEAVGCGEMDVPNAPVSGGARCLSRLPDS